MRFSDSSAQQLSLWPGEPSGHSPPLIEGPHFVYDDAPGLFLGRTGCGPLEVIWDTNVLVDYLQHGAAMWEGEPFSTGDAEYYSELEGLGLVINLWTRRDIRISILERSITDAKRRLSAERRLGRARAVDELASALSLANYGWEPEDGSGPCEQTSIPAHVLERLPDGTDRELVAEAADQGAHVFLTRDGGLLRCADLVKPYRLLLASPLDLVEELVACGAMLAVMRPETMYWPLPDLQRLSHLIQALGGTS